MISFSRWSRLAVLRAQLLVHQSCGAPAESVVLGPRSGPRSEVWQALGSHDRQSASHLHPPRQAGSTVFLHVPANEHAAENGSAIIQTVPASPSIRPRVFPMKRWLKPSGSLPPRLSSQTSSESAFALVFHHLAASFQGVLCWSGKGLAVAHHVLGVVRVVTQFNLDVMGALVRAYDPGLGLSNTAASSEFQAPLSAMIPRRGSSVSIGSWLHLVFPRSFVRIRKNACQSKPEGGYRSESRNFARDARQKEDVPAPGRL